MESTSIPAFSTSSTSSYRLACSSARRVGVRELIDQADLGLARRIAGRSISSRAVPRYSTSRRGITSSPQRSLGRRDAAVRLEQPDHDVAAGLLLGMALEQHPVGLADAGGHADHHAEAAAFHR